MSASSWYTTCVDCRDPLALGHFWAAVLGYEVVYQADDEVVIAKGVDQYPGLCFLSVRDEKTVKNRLHIDLDPDDQAKEVERVIALGARRIDIGQGEVSWVVLADPEGNEFCILRPHRNLAE